MTETPGKISRPAAQVVVKRSRHLSIVWLVPIIAALVGAWLGWQAINERGPTITIRFESAADLEAGKTKIRYRDVDVGKVEGVRLDEDLKHVLVTVRLDKYATPFLSKSTRFWVVRARVSSGEVSGLATLFSGAYIAVEPGRGGQTASSFVGLEGPPVLTGDLPGRYYVLRAERLGSLDIGAPVSFRQVRVGRVVNYALNASGHGIDVRIFVEAPHHQLVFTGTRFWKADGIDISLDASGVSVNTESLVTILAGGIAFENLPGVKPENPAQEEAAFKLHRDRRSSFEQEYLQKISYALLFKESVRGLLPGAAVEFRGMRIGQVTSVRIELDMDSLEFRTPVLIEVEPERIALSGQGSFADGTVMARLVKRGLRGQLKMANLLTGKLVVSLDFHPGAEAATITSAGSVPQIPTVATPLEEITGSFSRVMQKLDRICGSALINN